ncbi:MAG TPA: hypothetical protein VFQ83_07025 [Candidatus Udaeobacter sp.]|nr:hypothetical protein [Candidatus Udaeobacter sp.]
MKNQFETAILTASLLLSGCASTNTAHTPAEGGAERNAIILATKQALARQGRKNLVLVVPYLKVHNGWAWIQVNPQSADGKQHYESQSGLLQEKTANQWTLLEWMPAEEGTNQATYFKKLKAKYPAAPPDIFPQ